MSAVASADLTERSFARPVSFAHLSDPHLVPPPIPWKRFFNKRLLSRYFWQKRRRHHHLTSIRDALLNDIRTQSDLDAILISGDLTNFGTPEEFAQAARWLEELPVSPLVVPGNHDAMVHAPYEETLALWEKWGAPSSPYVRQFGEVAVIGVNSAVPNLPFVSGGYVSDDQLERLSSILDEHGRQGHCRVVMLHHPPRTDLLARRNALRNTDAVADILRRHGAELVLHGHSHDATLTTVENSSIPLLGVGAASMKHSLPRRAASWNRLSFTRAEQDWHISVTRRRYDGVVLQTMQWNSADFPTTYGAARSRKNLSAC